MRHVRRLRHVNPMPVKEACRVPSCNPCACHATVNDRSRSWAGPSHHHRDKHWTVPPCLHTLTMRGHYAGSSPCELRRNAECLPETPAHTTRPSKICLEARPRLHTNIAQLRKMRHAAYTNDAREEPLPCQPIVCQTFMTSHFFIPLRMPLNLSRSASKMGGLLRARAWPCLGPEGPDVMPGSAAGPPGHARAQSMTA